MYENLAQISDCLIIYYYTYSTLYTFDTFVFNLPYNLQTERTDTIKNSPIKINHQP